MLVGGYKDPQLGGLKHARAKLVVPTTLLTLAKELMTMKEEDVDHMLASAPLVREAWSTLQANDGLRSWVDARLADPTTMKANIGKSIHG